MGVGKLNIFKRDPFGKYLILKRALTLILGPLTYILIRVLNRIEITGTEILRQLPQRNILFVSNHQTYFVDAVAMYHVFNSSHWSFKNSISNPIYMLWPRLNLYYVAAEETMKSGIIPRMLAYFGSISIRRTFREKGQAVQRQVRFTDITNIGIALKDGWVITFPQGTTQPNAPGRRGVIYVIKKFKPIVVPVFIEGFNEAFDRKHLRVKKRGVTLKMTIKEPLDIDLRENPDLILSRIMDAIGQHPLQAPDPAE